VSVNISTSHVGDCADRWVGIGESYALNAKNLETLGPERLAELLIEISSRDAAAKRRLKLELAGARSPGITLSPAP